MMEEDFYATIKFKSGEEIFSKVSCSEEEDRTFLLLDTPVTIEKVRNKGSIYGYKFEPWLKTSKEDLLIINLEDVLTLVESKDVETIAMHKTFSHHQNQYIDNHQKKLNRKMGYISTINEAKASLEKLFKDN
tara:strand:+ start:177 stop:572 length:396 start_codon:yes stop_codon:yes gene_type:complete